MARDGTPGPLAGWRRDGRARSCRRAPRVNVSDGAHDRPVERHPDLVERGAAVVGILGVRRIRERSVPSGAAQAVEHRVALAAADVDPDRDDRLDAPRERCARRDEIDVPHETDTRRRGELVVDHLVQTPAIGRLVRVAVATRNVKDGLLLAAEEERTFLVVAPDSVVQVDDVHRRHLAVEVLQIRSHADDVAVDGRLLVLRDRNQLD